MQFSVPSMVCDGCVDVVTKAICSIDPNAHVVVNLETKSVVVDSSVDEATLKDAIVATGHSIE